MTVVEQGCVVSRVLTRKRGPALEQAILDAAYAELTDVGYAAFTVEGVAGRAHTGKASIYRRWPTRQLLVMDALATMLPSPEDRDLLADPGDEVTTAQALRDVAQMMSDLVSGPAGDAFRAIKCEAVTDPQLATLVDERLQLPGREALLGVLHRGVSRGEVRAEAATQLVADVIPALIMHRVMVERRSVTRDAIDDIVTRVMVPLVEPCP